MSYDNFSKKKKIISLVKLSILLVILVGIPLYLIIYHKAELESLKSLSQVMDFLSRHKTTNMFLYVAIQILQIVICIIPGQIFQFAAGWTFGFFIGLVLSVVGAIIGTLITFYLAKFLGRDALHIFFPPEKINYLVSRLNSKKGYIAVFIIYLIPGLPKDMMGYAAGLSNMNLKLFLLTSILGRIPAMSGSLLIGALYFSKHYTAMIIIGILAVLLFGICILQRNKIKIFLDKIYDENKVTKR